VTQNPCDPGPTDPLSFCFTLNAFYVSFAVTTILPGKCYPRCTLRTVVLYVPSSSTRPRCSAMAAIVVVVAVIMKMTSHHIDVTILRVVEKSMAITSAEYGNERDDPSQPTRCYSSKTRAVNQLSSISLSAVPNSQTWTLFQEANKQCDTYLPSLFCHSATAL